MTSSKKRSFGGGSPSAACSRLERVGLVLYVAGMALLFGLQAIMSIETYFAGEIVEDVSVTPRKSTVLPGLTLCPYPGFRLQTNPVDIDSYCQEGEEVSADCLDKILLTQEDLFSKQIATFPALHVYNTSSVLRRAHLNLAQGTCFTFESGEDSERSSLRTDVLGVLPGEGRVVSFILLAHQHGGFVSALGLGSQFAGELTLSTRTEEPYSIMQIELETMEVERLNRPDFPCDQDPEYNLARCLEDHVERKIGCKSRWDRYPSEDPQSRECQSRDDLARLVAEQFRLYDLNGVPFAEETGCLQPCHYQKFNALVRKMINKDFMVRLAGPNSTGIGLSVHSTNRKKVTERYLYELTNLVGEVGGSMGLFLGASLVSFYQAAVALARRGYNNSFSPGK